VGLTDALRTHWASQGIRPGFGAPEAALVSFETRHQVRLPPALRSYFAEVNGIRRTVDFRDEWDQDLIRFWPLHEVQPLSAVGWESAPHEADSLFVFADWSIIAWFYVVRLCATAETPTPVYIAAQRLTLVADSFEKFLERYLVRDPTVIFPPDDQ
jgi:hypothetical protein